MKNKERLSKGITLISLVVTIIVLLILAGVALTMLSGENGILTRAKTARDQHQAGQELEENRLAGMENVMGEYLGNTAHSSTTGGANSGSSTGSETGGSGSGGTSQDQEPVTYTVAFYADSEDTEPLDEKTINSGESIESSNMQMPQNPTKTGNTFVGWKLSDNSEFTASTTISEDTSVYADWTPSGTPAGTAISDSTHYGDYFDLGTEILGTKTNGIYSSTRTLEGETTTIKADWRIFSKDSTGVWLILADYFPASTYLNSSSQNFITSTIGLSLASNTNSYPYSVRSTSSRGDLIGRLRGTRTVWRNDEGRPWKELLPSGLQINDDIVAHGALTVSEWQAGWNSKYTGNEQISVSGSESYGYSDCNVSSKAGYSNTLYFPHKSSQSWCDGYWLASKNSSETMENIIVVFNSGGISSQYYTIEGRGVRPAVHLPLDINLEQDSTTGIWKISN